MVANFLKLRFFLVMSLPTKLHIEVAYSLQTTYIYEFKWVVVVYEVG
jgi:hypothetical protein